MKYELGRKILTDFVGLRPKTNSYLTDDSNENKKAKFQRKYVINQISNKVKFWTYWKIISIV